MLSIMENSHRPSRSLPEADARAALDDAAAARVGFAHDLRLPPGYSLTTGIGNAALTFGIALGNSNWRFGPVAFALSLVCQAAAAAFAIRRFRETNGAWVSGFNGPRGTWPAVAAFLLALVPSIVLSTWLMVEGHGLASALVALCVIPLTAIADRWWMARFRAAR